MILTFLFYYPSNVDTWDVPVSTIHPKGSHFPYTEQFVI